MKKLFISLSIFLNSLTAYAKENCLERYNGNFCEGEKVFDPYAEEEGRFFGEIKKVDLAIAGQKNTGSRHILFNDGSIQNDRDGYHTYYKLTQLKKCALFSDNKVCIHTKVPVSDFSDGWVGVMEVIAIAKSPFDEEDALYGYMIIGGGKKKVGYARQIAINQGKVPGIDNLKFREKFQNAFGNFDSVEFYDPKYKKYFVKEGGSPETKDWYSKEKLLGRLSKKLKIPIEITRLGEATLDTWDRDFAYSTIAWRTELYLSAKCQDEYFGKHGRLINIVSKIENFKSEIEFKKYVGNHVLDFNIPWPFPRWQVSGINTMSAECIYIPW